MLINNNKKTKCIVIDLDGDYLKIASAELKRESFILNIIWQGVVKENCNLEIADIINKNKADIIATLPTAEGLTRWLDMPFNGKASYNKIYKILPSLLDVQLPFPLEECAYHFLDHKKIGSSDNYKTLAVAARLKSVENRLELFKKLAINPDVIDYEGLALSAGITEVEYKNNELTVLVYLGYKHSVIVLFNSNGFVSAHNCSFGVDGVEEAWLRVRYILADKVNNLKSNTWQWFWAGPGVKNSLILKRLEKEFIFEKKPIFNIVSDPENFLVCSLAKRFLSIGSKNKKALLCNLRQKNSILKNNLYNHQKKIIKTFFVILFLSFFVFFLDVFWLFSLKYKEIKTKNNINKLAKYITGLNNIPKGQEILLAQRALDNINIKEERDFFVKAIYDKNIIIDILSPLLKIFANNNIKISGLYFNDNKLNFSIIFNESDNNNDNNKEKLKTLSMALKDYLTDIEIIDEKDSREIKIIGKVNSYPKNEIFLDSSNCFDSNRAAAKF